MEFEQRKALCPQPAARGSTVAALRPLTVEEGARRSLVDGCLKAQKHFSIWVGWSLLGQDNCTVRSRIRIDEGKADGPAGRKARGATRQLASTTAAIMRSCKCLTGVEGLRMWAPGRLASSVPGPESCTVRRRAAGGGGRRRA